MAEQWFYVVSGQPKGPVGRDALEKVAREGGLERTTLVWKEGMADWVEAQTVSGLFAAPPVRPGGPGDGAFGVAAPAPPPAPSPAPSPAPRPQQPQAPAGESKGLFGGIGAKLSEVADLPTLGNVPVGEILMGGLKKETRLEDIEEVFIAGTATTTPQLHEIPAGWPIPRVFWRILGGAVGTYTLMRIGLTSLGNPNFIPGMIVIGSFVVPLSVVVLFFELNTPRNVSVYQIGKMLLLGGALSLFLAVVLFSFVPGTGTGALIPAILTGVVEETGKALALLLIVNNVRYPWQLNGLLFGGAVGAGFAGFESAGYAFRFLLNQGVGSALDIIMLRGLLAPGGHVIWTAMVASAIWKVKGERRFEMGMLTHPIVVRRWAIAVVLHGIWDATPLVDYRLWYGGLCVVGWYFVLAIAKQALAEVEGSRRESTMRMSAPAQARAV